eukprot:758835-Amphidinium_carterae.1
MLVEHYFNLVVRKACWYLVEMLGLTDVTIDWSFDIGAKLRLMRLGLEDNQLPTTVPTLARVWSIHRNDAPRSNMFPNPYDELEPPEVYQPNNKDGLAELKLLLGREDLAR